MLAKKAKDAILWLVSNERRATSIKISEIGKKKRYFFCKHVKAMEILVELQFFDGICAKVAILEKYPIIVETCAICLKKN